MQLTINGSNYFVQKTGHGQPLWLLLHGFMGSHQDFSTITSQLTGTVLIPDLLGHGQTKSSSHKVFTMTQQVRDLADLLFKLAPGQSINLWGYSMGGRVAIDFARTFPQKVQCLIAESSRPGIASSVERQKRQAHDQQLADKLMTIGLPAFVDSWERLPLFATQKQLPVKMQQRIRRQRLTQNPVALAKSLTQMGTGAQPNDWPKLAELDCPVLLLTGEKDQKFTAIAQQMLNGLPNAIHKVMPKVGHNLHLEAPQAVLTVIHQGVCHVSH